jgi:hypothetical protein
VSFVRQQLDARMAQLDEDERMALAATGGAWRWTDPGGRIKLALVAGVWPSEVTIVPSARPDVYPSHLDAGHIVRWDPNRVLAEVELGRAEVEAKRRILDWALMWMGRDCAPWNADCIRLLAQPYAGRPGWREEWAV